MHELTFHFDEAFVRKALRRDVWDRGWIATGLMVVVAIVMRVWTGEWSPLILGIIAVGTAVLWFLLFRTLRSAARQIVALWRTQSPDGTMTFRFTEEGYELEIASASSQNTWKGLRRLWRYDDVWIIEIVKRMSVFFPPSAADPETLAFVEARCREAGVRV